MSTIAKVKNLTIVDTLASEELSTDRSSDTDSIFRLYRPTQSANTLTATDTIARYKNRTLKWTDTIARYKNRTLKQTDSIARYKSRKLKFTDCVGRYNRKIESVSEDRTIGPFAHLCLSHVEKNITVNTLDRILTVSTPGLQ